MIHIESRLEYIFAALKASNVSCVANSRDYKLYLKAFKLHFLIYSIRQDTLYGNIILRQTV